MESFGETLQKAREALSIDIEKAARDTSISINYIEALENEDTTVFPGEPYLVGFLRNYSEYLGLEPKHLITLYKAKTIQEAPIPEGLLKDPVSPKKVPIIITVCISVVLILGILGYFLYSTKQKEINELNTATEKIVNKYTITTVPIQKRLYADDILEFQLASGKVELTVQNTNGALVLNTPMGLQYVELGEEIKLDVDGDITNDLVITLSDISKTDEARGAEVRMFLLGDSEAPVATVVDENVIVEESKAISTTATTATQANTTKQTVLIDDNRAYPFTLNTTFRGSCLFRYACDRKESVEDYYTTGDIIVMQANNTIRVWMSNANALKLEVIADGRTIGIEVGRPGQVLVQDVKWIKDTDGRYKLVVVEVD